MLSGYCRRTQQRPAIALCPERRIEQHRLEHLAVDRNEGQGEQEPRASRGQCRGHLLFEVDLPAASHALLVHPHANAHKHCRSEEARQPLRHFTVRSTDGDEVRRRTPRRRAGKERRHPAGVDIAKHIWTFRFAQERNHGNHDEQGLKTLAQQDGEAAQEGSCPVRL